MLDLYIQHSPFYDPTRGDCILASFAYNEKLIQIIKTIPGTIWRPDLKCWEMRKCMFKVFVYAAKRYKAQIDCDINWHIEVGLFNSSDTSFDFNSVPPLKTTPFEYQIQGIKFGVRNKRFLLGDEPGVGKTLQIIGLHHYLRHTEGHKKTLVICGINGNKYNWLEEVEKHSNYTAHVIGSRRGKRSGKLTPGG